MIHPRRCRHTKIRQDKLSNANGTYQLTEACEECGTKWVYKRCFVCDQLADEEKIEDARKDIQKRGVPD